MSWSGVIHLWQHSDDFRAMFSGFLRQAPFENYFFEMPPVSRNSLQDYCEFVLVNAHDSFDRMSASPQAFARQLETSKERGEQLQFAAFLNLNGDTMLIAPHDLWSLGMLSERSKDPDVVACYLNIGMFFRHCPAQQNDALWEALGEQLSIRFTTSALQTPVYVSTSGLGVPWLHVRLDTFPKYYTFEPYRSHENSSIFRKLATWINEVRQAFKNNTISLSDFDALRNSELRDLAFKYLATKREVDAALDNNEPRLALIDLVLAKVPQKECNELCQSIRQNWELIKVEAKQIVGRFGELKDTIHDAFRHIARSISLDGLGL